MVKKINHSNEILWLSFPALEKFDFLQQGLILKNKTENLFSDKSKLKQDLENSLKCITGNKGEVIYANQVHKNKSAVIDSHHDARNWDCSGEFDAFITNQKNVYLTVRVADCLPIYLFEPVAQVIGLIHAGWRSTLLKIVEKTSEQIQANFEVEMSNLRAVIGPGLGKNCFEVSEELAILFHPDCLTAANSSKPRLDLAQVNFKQLLKAGVNPENITVIRECTHCDPQLYYSYRRTSNKCQRMVAFIGLKG